jgi:hypothetical protein
MPSQPMATWITPRSSRSAKFVGIRTCRHTMGLIPVSQNLTCRSASVSAAGFSSGTGPRPSFFRPDYRLAQFIRRRTPQRSRCSRAFLVACTRRGGQHPRRIRKLANACDRRLVRARRSHVAIHLTKPFLHLLSALAGSSTTMRCIMPERLAATNPFREVTEMIWSGPYRFLPTEFNAGERAAYERFTGYPHRGEGTLSYTAGPNRRRRNNAVTDVVGSPSECRRVV